MSFDFALDPFENMRLLIAEAEASGIKEPNAISLATVSLDGRPDVRAVLFKGLVRGGLSFYTNYNSPKALHLEKNPNACGLFFWAALAQQIRISGTVDKLTRAESEAYFATRPRESQIGAWASEQSQEISSFQDLQAKAVQLEKKYANQKVPCPPHWGGYRLIPLHFEFWFGRIGRMHERYTYERSSESQSWQRRLLSP